MGLTKDAGVRPPRKRINLLGGFLTVIQVLQIMLVIKTCNERRIP
jgi:hypothetical protein